MTFALPLQHVDKCLLSTVTATPDLEKYYKSTINTMIYSLSQWYLRLLIIRLRIIFISLIKYPWAVIQTFQSLNCTTSSLNLSFKHLDCFWYFGRMLFLFWLSAPFWSFKIKKFRLISDTRMRTEMLRRCPPPSLARTMLVNHLNPLMLVSTCQSSTCQWSGTFYKWESSIIY